MFGRSSPLGISGPLVHEVGIFSETGAIEKALGNENKALEYKQKAKELEGK